MTRDRLYLDMMQSVLGNTNKVIVDQKGGSNLLYLPLDKLMQQTMPGTSTDSPVARPPVAAPEAVPPAAAADSRTREGLRNRER